MSGPGHIPEPPPARARLLDLSRLLSRVGRGPWTGVDRVEAAYLAHFLNHPDPFFALARTGLGFVLLDRKGAQAVQDRLAGRVPWGRIDLLSRLFLKAGPEKRAAESDLRRLALARSGLGGLAAMLKRHLPTGTSYLNVGHSNLVPSVFDAVHGVPGATATVLIHDTIPLDYPEYQRPGTVAAFEARLDTVAAHADLVIYNSAQSRTDGERHMDLRGRVPPGIVAHLGVERPVPVPETIPAHLDLERPYFVTLGTIEPRKNHALLLDLWGHMAATLPAADMPQLFIIGNRGWNNDAVFARLDARPAHVQELANLEDGAMAALMQGARALLFPSFAEGFGLPPCEAALMGVPVIANDLPVLREILGNIPIYANAGDMYSWEKTIRQLAEQKKVVHKAGAGDGAELANLTWDAHFNLVLKQA